MTLNGVAVILRFYTNSVALGPITSQRLKLDPYCVQQKYSSPKESSFRQYIIYADILRGSMFNKDIPCRQQKFDQ